MNLGLDTSVVLRLLIGQPADLALVARQRLEQAHAENDKVVVTDLVIAEAYYALVHHYKRDKDEARQLLQRMTTSGIVHSDPPQAVAALDAAPGAGLVDRLILHRHRSFAATTLTFDRALGAAGAVLLEPPAAATS
jgi:predicted nucleic-acid-binding protein